jgi:hypothetical protein
VRVITHRQPRALAKSTAAVGIVMLTLLVASCSAPGDDDPAPTSSASASTSAAEAEIASATATLEDGTVDVIVRSLERDDNGSTMTLRVAFVPHLEGDDTSYTLAMMNGYIFVHPVLLDRENLKRYNVIEGEGAQDWLTNKAATTVDGEPLESWFVYAAPEDDIDAITFTMDAWSIELPDIPITGDR